MQTDKDSPRKSLRQAAHENMLYYHPKNFCDSEEKVELMAVPNRSLYKNLPCNVEIRIWRQT
jgi:hypothetical protein